MSEILWMQAGPQAVLEFSGPDAVRFLNGQMTQDVRLVAERPIALPSCVTDAKGRLQFRVMITRSPGGGLWVTGPAEWAEDLEARLTRYLIADDVEVVDRTGQFTLIHFLSPMELDDGEGAVRLADRLGRPGMDRWVPAGQAIRVPSGAREMAGDEVEALRITHGVPAWGHELEAGMLPPEALLDRTDVSYHKGCYIGQEVISRIKSAGKVNRLLTCFSLDPGMVAETGPLVTQEALAAGALTSVSPLTNADGSRDALGYVKRGAERVFLPGGVELKRRER